MKIGFISLGCPKNQLDTEVMLNELRIAGYEITPDETEADIIVVNTCAFIEAAKRESIDNILDAAWLKKNHTLRGLIVTGCMAERYRDEVLKEFPEVDAVLGVGSIHDIVDAVREVGKGQRGYSSFLPKDEVKLGGDRVLTTPQFWTYLKIAEGCDNRCTYCAIPSIRGKFRSRPIEELVAEARDLEALGAREISIIAQDITRYGVDLYGEYSLARLLRELTAATKTVYFRLLYCYPDKVTDELVAEIRDNPRVLKYVDIPLQHISDSVLRRMNRHGDSAMIRDVIKRLRDNVPGIVLRTTFITGFPGETEEDFEALCEFLHEFRLERAGVFPYSPEPGSLAATYPDQVDEDVKRRRVELLTDLQMRIVDDYCANMVGKVIEVLCEGYDDETELYYGRSAADSPDIDGLVHFEGEEGGVRPGGFYRVKVTNFYDGELVGVRYEDDEEEAQ